jgi:alpha-D-ribose 1-methylphosphonate 5-triphosphate synthase subunit PhnI
MKVIGIRDGDYSLIKIDEIEECVFESVGFHQTNEDNNQQKQQRTENHPVIFKKYYQGYLDAYCYKARRGYAEKKPFNNPMATCAIDSLVSTK